MTAKANPYKDGDTDPYELDPYTFLEDDGDVSENEDGEDEGEDEDEDDSPKEKQPNPEKVDKAMRLGFSPPEDF